nr:MAG TPA: hypothetical protein [Crassvirales sp.]
MIKLNFYNMNLNTALPSFLKGNRTLIKNK